MLAQALEANGAIVYIMGRRRQALEEAAKTAVCVPEPRLFMKLELNLTVEARQPPPGRGGCNLQS
jgi:hypothetical protein